MLIDKFEDLLNKFSGTNFKSEPQIFLPEQFPELEQILECVELKIVSRQRFVSNGLMDNLIIETDKKTARAFGFWLMSAAFQRKYPAYYIKLKPDNDAVTEIKFVCKNSLKLFIEPVKFQWNPRKIEEFVSDPEYILGDVPRIYLTNETGEWITMEEFRRRNVVEINSSVGGAFFLAEFFLNIGVKESDVNYEYLKYEYDSCILSDNSCEMRAEVFHKPDREQNTISALIN